jgi:hypothetical protein
VISIKKVLSLSVPLLAAIFVLSSCANSAVNTANSQSLRLSDGVKTNVSGANHNSIGKISIAVSGNLLLSQAVKNDSFSANIPSTWKVTNIGDDGYTFGKDKNNDIGGIYRQEYDIGGNETMPTIKNLIKWMLPNHSETTSLQKISGFPSDTYLLNVITSNTAAGSDSTVKTWTYIILTDKNKTTASKFVAYEIFINTEFASEQDALKVAGTFKIL